MLLVRNTDEHCKCALLEKVYIRTPKITRVDFLGRKIHKVFSSITYRGAAKGLYKGCIKQLLAGGIGASRAP